MTTRIELESWAVEGLTPMQRYLMIGIVNDLNTAIDLDLITVVKAVEILWKVLNSQRKGQPEGS